MPRKIDLITELYKRTIKDITSDSVAWRAFLHSAAYQYKYPAGSLLLRGIFSHRKEMKKWGGKSHGRRSLVGCNPGGR